MTFVCPGSMSQGDDKLFVPFSGGNLLSRVELESEVRTEDVVGASVRGLT
jgi:hypothetical protein